ncbi:MAG: hypothetical protein MPEBLZ_03238 [Candidatus Methanoperedens nitroreducens]|uniref:Uncharacterized protein n=1 Tax=Candidatus Methanoperedens nitratireducens TaxID=1392998 RepID=A0A0P7ZFA2_9EURY|nr:MAG: hypothetical protein MPEBLZ_03238 [Candidatus Methanoperedens sp. BLZ1]
MNEKIQDSGAEAHEPIFKHRISGIWRGQKRKAKGIWRYELKVNALKNVDPTDAEGKP